MGPPLGLRISEVYDDLAILGIRGHDIGNYF